VITTTALLACLGRQLRRRRRWRQRERKKPLGFTKALPIASCERGLYTIFICVFFLLFTDGARARLVARLPLKPSCAIIRGNATNSLSNGSRM
jgi:hypothetical protein